MLDERWGVGAGEIAAKAAAENNAPKLSPFQLSKRIEATIESDIRPMLVADGGDVELIDIKENLVYMTLTGACASCPGASGTIHYVVEKKLREQVDDALRVIEV